MTAPITATTAGPDWVRDAIFYQIFPDRFALGDPLLHPDPIEDWTTGIPTRDNFFGGDLPGITGRLGHLTALGVTGIYLTPVFTAGTNHRYDAHDYLTIDPGLGGDQAFGDFLAGAHHAGMAVLLDAVFHHCGHGHPAFQDVIRNGQNSPYIDWFSVHEHPVHTDPVPNYATCSGCWYLPKLNVDNPQLRRHLFDVTRHWLAAGIDGWRLDVPYMLENPWFWREFRSVVRKARPDAYVVAECWESAGDWTGGSMSDAAMNYRLRDAILDFVGEWRGGAQKFADELAAIDAEIPIDSRGLMLNLLGSHDTERVLTHVGGDRAAAGLAFGLLFAMEGAPMIYYGDEIGMAGFNDPDCRAPMIWDRSRWDTDHFEWVCRLASIRAASVALRRGTQSVQRVDGENVLIVQRDHPQQRVLITANRGRHPTTVDLGEFGVRGRDLISGRSIDLASVSLSGQGVRYVEAG